VKYYDDSGKVLYKNAFTIVKTASWNTASSTGVTQ
jgi:hypothetical protein